MPTSRAVLAAACPTSSPPRSPDSGRRRPGSMRRSCGGSPLPSGRVSGTLRRKRFENWRRVLVLRDLTDRAVDVPLWRMLCEAADAAADSPRHGGFSLPDQPSPRSGPGRRRTGPGAPTGRWNPLYGGDLDEGLAFLDQARRLVDVLPPSVELVDVLLTRIANLSQVGRYDVCRADLARAMDLLAGHDDGVSAATGAHVVGVVRDGRWGIRPRATLVDAARAAAEPGADPQADLIARRQRHRHLVAHGCPPAALAEVSAAAAGDGSPVRSRRGIPRQPCCEATWPTPSFAAVTSTGPRRCSSPTFATHQHSTRRCPTSRTQPWSCVAVGSRRRWSAVQTPRPRRSVEVRTGPRSSREYAEVQLWAGSPDAAVALLEETTGRHASHRQRTDRRAHARLVRPRMRGPDGGHAKPGPPSGTCARRRMSTLLGQARVDPFGSSATGVLVPAWEIALARRTGAHHTIRRRVGLVDAATSLGPAPSTTRRGVLPLAWRADRTASRPRNPRQTTPPTSRHRRPHARTPTPGHRCHRGVKAALRRPFSDTRAGGLRARRLDLGDVRLSAAEDQGPQPACC